MSHVLKIESMKITGDNNIVNEVRCFLTVTADTGKSETSVFSIELDEPDANNFIEFNNLTEEQVNDWVVNVLGEDELNARIYGLESKSDTHDLVHSFIEGPQADLIYRGKVNLVDGSATVNIDTIAGMTEGTFVILNREVQCFTTNESDWDAVKGSVSGNILTIECQNTSSTATVSWMVIGERQDAHMYDTEWTDEDGRVIVEPLKESTESTANTA